MTSCCFGKPAADHRADPFPLTFGRAIGPLVKFIPVTKDRSALDLAVKLKDYC